MNLNKEDRVVVNDVSTKLLIDTIEEPIETNDSVETKLEISGKVIAKYVDIYGKEISVPITKRGLVGEAYQTNALQIDGYRLNKISGIESGKYTDGEVEVIYVYVTEDSDILLPPQTNSEPNIYLSLLIALITLCISVKKIIKL